MLYEWKTPQAEVVRESKNDPRSLDLIARTYELYWSRKFVFPLFNSVNFHDIYLINLLKHIISWNFT